MLCLQTTTNRTALLLFFSSIFFSCTKNGGGELIVDESVCRRDSLISTWSSGGQVYEHKQIFQYDDEGRQILGKTFDNGSVSDIEEYTYGADDIPTTLLRKRPDGTPSEEFKFIYDANGKAQGYDHINYFGRPFSESKTRYLYGDTVFTVAGIFLGDTTSKIIRYYRDGNNYRSEIWQSRKLTYIDSTWFDNRPLNTFGNPEKDVARYGMLLNKNLHTRIKRYDVLNDRVYYDDLYDFTTDSKGLPVMYSISTNMTFPIPVTPRIARNFYTCP